MRIFSTTALALALGLATGFADDLKLYWSFQTIDATGEIGGYSKPRFDKNDNLKVAYRGHYDIKYAELVGGVWKVQTADTGTGSAAKVDLALDPSGNPHIIYQSADYKSVYYTKLVGKNWTHALAGSTQIGNLDFYQITSAADSKGGVHMAFSKERLGWPNLFHQYVDKNGVFSDTGNVVPKLTGKWCGMVLDANENPVITYFENTDELLKVSWIDSGAWKEQVVGAGLSPQPLGYHAAIAKESDTAYRLIYQDKYKHEIWTATGRPGGAWATEKIDTTDGFAFFSAQNTVAVGKGGIPYVAYDHIKSADGETIDACRLYFAYKEAGVWKKIVVDSAGITGEFSSMAVDSKGQPAITYFDRTNHALRIAYGSLTPVAIHRPDHRLRPAHGGHEAPRFDANGKKEMGTRSPTAPDRKILFTRPADAR